MPQLSTCLWFDGEAEAAARFYTGIFPNSQISQIVSRPPGVPGKQGDVLTVTFELDGRPFLGLNGGPQFTFNQAVSLIVPCQTQAEIDHYWSRLGDGGEAIACGWLKDRYGLAWQIVPAELAQWMGGDAARTARVTAAFMQMVKFDIAALEQAARG